MRLLTRLIGQKLLLGLIMIGLLSSCSSVEVTDYKDTHPTLVLESFFNGPLKASGIVHDFSGKVIRKFNVTMEASWQGNEGVINEWFVYDDGETQTRVWRIKALGKGDTRELQVTLSAPPMVNPVVARYVGNTICYYPWMAMNTKFISTIGCS
ncbi:hypothetical protein LFREDSHE_14410 [Shewanella baltica]